MGDLRPERDVRKKLAEQEKSVAEDRDYAEWAKDIGPEGMSPEKVAEYLEEYGWNQMDDDAFVSNPATPADMPDWARVEKDMVYDNYDSSLKDDLEKAVTSLQSERPVEDEVADRLDGDVPEDTGD